MTTPRIVALIVAAGRGERMGGGLPKQFLKLAGTTLVDHAHSRLSAHPAIAGVVTVVAPEFADRVSGRTVAGGDSRRQSVLNGLEAIARGGGADLVLIHDAARPLIPAAVIDRLIAALGLHAGALPVLPVADTVALAGDVLGDTVDRSTLVRVQTPQGFDFAAILAAHRAWPAAEEATDDAQVLRRAGGTVATVAGDPLLDKITWPGDIAIAEARLGNNMRSRTATGFDVHRLEAGEELWMGGVLIPHDKGLSGHSDADVALHAITDALLGTIAAGDIGQHFPPSDPKWRGAESGQFLQHAASLVTAKGGVIDFVDLTIMCEAPKIGPHRAAMRKRIAELLALDEDQVSVKATTTERLGFTGRGEGIAAQAAVTVRA